mmetsp:Transcript_82367/g.266732  ORF Transcript_82367/g.266732 Transcript_82367/m.266732 type:complete len:297 (+) Transcript_82367:1336-2226(+)
MRRAQLKVLQVNRSRHCKCLGDVDLCRQADIVAFIWHDVTMLDVHLVLSIQGTEMAMKSLGVDVVDVQWPRRLSVCRKVLAATSGNLASTSLCLALQNLFDLGKAAQLALSVCIGGGRGRQAQDAVISMRKDGLTIRDGRRRGEAELCAGGASLEQPSGGIEMGLNSRSNLLGRRRGRRVGAVVRHSTRTPEHAVVGWVVARPSEEAALRRSVIGHQFSWQHHVHVAMRNVGPKVEHAREEEHVTLGQGRQIRLQESLTLPCSIGLHIGPQCHWRKAFPPAPGCAGASRILKGLQV